MGSEGLRSRRVETFYSMCLQVTTHFQCNIALQLSEGRSYRRAPEADSPDLQNMHPRSHMQVVICRRTARSRSTLC